MNKNSLIKRIGLVTALLTITFFAGKSLREKRELRYGDYIKEENAYFAGYVNEDDELGEATKALTPTDSYYNTQKQHSNSVSMIGDLEGVWESYTGKGTTVAIIDDGFDVSHQEYTRSDGTSAILNTSRYYHLNNAQTEVVYEEYSSDPTCIEEDYVYNSSTSSYGWNTHGTETSTTAAAPMNNGGIVGVAPDANILAIKIDMKLVTMTWAIQYAVQQGVDVINMSIEAFATAFTDPFGKSIQRAVTDTTYFDNICNYAYNNNVIVVASAGNHATSYKSYPACSSHVIGVGALNDNKPRELAPYTDIVADNATGEINVDILAPGTVFASKISGTENNPTRGYSTASGTSFSSPMVAGAACLWKEKYPDGTPDQFLSQLQSTASDIGYYESLNVPAKSWGASSDVGPSNIECGRMNISNLLDIDTPYVQLEDSNVTVSIGETKQINFKTINGTASYVSNDTSVATVSNLGLITGVSGGDTSITVTVSKNNKNTTATVNVHVNNAINCTSLSVDPDEVEIEVGKTYEIEPTLITTPANATREFVFLSYDESVAQVDIETGAVTALKKGTTIIEIEPMYGSAQTSLTVNVVDAATPTSWDKVTSTNEVTNGDYLIVYEASSKAFNGALTTLDVTNNYIGVTITNNKITYTNATAAAKVTINAITGGYSIKTASGYYIGRTTNSNGMDSSTTNVYTNSISFSNGSLTIAGSGGKKLSFNSNTDQQRFRYLSTANVALYKATGGASETVSVTGVTLSTNALNLTAGQSQTLTATVLPDNATNKNVTWTSSNTGVATIENGTVTAVAAGSATITVTTIDGGHIAQCNVTVTSATVPVTGVSLSPTELNLTAGQSQTLTATISPSNATNKAVSWESNNTGVATVDNGTVTAVSEGSATITVTTSDGGHIAQCSVTVSSGSSQQESSFDITFKTGSGDGTSMSTSTAESSYLSAGGDYVKSIESVDKAYYAGSNGLKLGASSSAGTLSLNLENSYYVKSIVVNTKLYNSSKAATLNVNNIGAQNVTSSFSNLTFNIDSTTERITLNSSKYIWVSGLTVNLEVDEGEVTNVTATCAKTFKPGETITKSDISATLTYESGHTYPTTDFEFTNYQFLYSDAPSGGTVGTKQLSITYDNNNYTFNVNVARENYISPTTTDLTLTGSQGKSAGITGTGASGANDYSSLIINGVTCSATNVYIYNNNYFSFGQGSGEIHNTVALDKSIINLSITTKSGARTDQKLYVSTDGDTYVLLANADFDNIDYRYFKVAYESADSKYSNFDTITLTLKNNETLTSVSNYIMYEDTNNQCNIKLDIALKYFENLTKTDRATFMTSDDYVISNARTRLLAWAASKGKSITYRNDDYIVNNLRNIDFININNDTNSIIILTSVALLSIITIFVFVTKKEKIN